MIAALLDAMPPGFDGRWPALRARYAEPHRHHHGLGHLEHLGALFAEVAAHRGWDRPREVAATLLFHDAVYAPGRPDNEARSAALAVAALADLDVDAERVAAWIRATATHALPDGAAEDGDLAHLLDADMAVLGADPAAFETYQRGIEAEYRGRVPAVAFRLGRRRFLRKLAAAPRIFQSPWGRRRFAAQARRNLAAALGAPAPGATPRPCEG